MDTFRSIFLTHNLFQSSVPPTRPERCCADHRYPLLNDKPKTSIFFFCVCMIKLTASWICASLLRSIDWTTGSSILDCLPIYSNPLISFGGKTPNANPGLRYAAISSTFYHYKKYPSHDGCLYHLLTDISNFIGKSGLTMVGIRYHFDHLGHF